MISNLLGLFALLHFYVSVIHVSWCTICIIRIYIYIFMKRASLITWIIAILASLLKLSFSSQQNKSILWWPLESVSGCKKAVNIPSDSTDSPNSSTILHYLPANHSILRPRTETLEEYHVAHGDGSDRDVGTCTWRVTLEGRKIQQTWISEKPFSTFKFLCH